MRQSGESSLGGKAMWLGRGIRGQAHPLPGSQFKFKQMWSWHKQSQEPTLTERQESEVSVPSSLSPHPCSALRTSLRCPRGPQGPSSGVPRLLSLPVLPRDPLSTPASCNHLQTLPAPKSCLQLCFGESRPRPASFLQAHCGLLDTGWVAVCCGGCPAGCQEQPLPLP